MQGSVNAEGSARCLRVSAYLSAVVQVPVCSFQFKELLLLGVGMLQYFGGHFQYSGLLFESSAVHAKSG